MIQCAGGVNVTATIVSGGVDADADAVVTVPTDVRAAYVTANAIVFVLYVTYILATLTAWRVVLWCEGVRANLLRKRSFPLIAISAFGGCLTACYGPLRAAIGSERYPCSLLLWDAAGTTVLVVAPMVVSLERFYHTHALNRRIGEMNTVAVRAAGSALAAAAAAANAEAEGASLPAVTKRRLTRAATTALGAVIRSPSAAVAAASASSSNPGDSPRSEERSMTMTVDTVADAMMLRSLQALRWRAGDAHTFVVLFVAVLPAIVGTVVLQATVPQYALAGCRGCEYGVIEFATFSGAGVYLMLVGIWIARRLRGLHDPFGLTRDPVVAIVLSAILGFPGFICVLLDPGQFRARNVFNWDWMLIVTTGAFHTVLCTIPLLRALRAGNAGEHHVVGVGKPAMTQSEFARALRGDPAFHAAFSEHCEREWCAENLRFLDVAEDYRASATTTTTTLAAAGTRKSARTSFATDILWVFIRDGAPLQVNLPHSLRLTTEKRATAGDVDAFDEAVAEITSVLYRDAFSRFAHRRSVTAIVSAAVLLPSP